MRIGGVTAVENEVHIGAAPTREQDPSLIKASTRHLVSFFKRSCDSSSVPSKYSKVRIHGTPLRKSAFSHLREPLNKLTTPGEVGFQVDLLARWGIMNLLVGILLSAAPGTKDFAEAGALGNPDPEQ